ncbi:glycoside hydrolase family 70 protein [Streptococcus tangpeifui]|uniref:glycoside hydrolase family 70 protein n=1 Tax=Streptococcus tangpeifui TaxID=2709400 RepID=UPI0037DA22F4
MEQKLHYKLHKVKKHWVTIAVATAGLVTLVGAGTVSAEENTGTDTAAQTAAVEESGQQNQAKADDANTVNDSASSDQTVAADQNQADTQNQATAEQAIDQGQAADQAQAQTQTPATDGTAVVRQDAANVATAADQQQAGPSEQEKTAAMSLDNVKQVDGKYYYVQADGSYKKNFAITVNGQMLYFDGDTGALSSTSTYSFSQGLTNIVDDFTSHNKAYDSTAKSFELVDGYLTANSWYRPASILRNGQTWEASNENDLRPVLMSWWPDKDTQVAYLNYMTKYLGAGNEEFTNETSQTALNKAAQLVQTRIEQKITSDNNTEWLRTAIKAFVATQSKWNMSTENFNKSDHLQGGALLYTNSDLTPWANSDYRLLNRTPTMQTGEQKYFDEDGMGGYEFLLSNDVDNSNPVVQAEMLNQLHYLMNWGSIVLNDKDANFDGVRVDAVDNVNADLLQVYTNYFEEYYKVNQKEANALAHLSILEAWSGNDNWYNTNTNGAALSIDNQSRLTSLAVLTKQPGQRVGLESIISDSVNKERGDDRAYGDSIPTYSFVRAHDSEVQTVIAKIIKEKIDTNTDGYTFTLDQLKDAFKIYNEDMNKVSKTYTHYNMPAAYALLLSNMESVPRVYYGDLYTDDGQYMAKKTPYYDAITTMLQGRIAYVSGGQNEQVHTVNGSNKVLASVRFGQDIMSADDTQGTDLSRTSGMVTLVSNDPNLNLGGDSFKVNMGKAHANQAYRPLLLGTNDGVKSYLKDSDTSLVKYTDADGNLTFTADDIKGYSTVDMSGYLAVWVPVGAKDGQDIRVAASTADKGPNRLTFESSAALDSQVIYEGFSNFQDFAASDADYTNKKIAENADFFKKLGITSFEMAPQYVSATDGSFLDSIIENSYAFSDRYDLAMSKNNKYGSKEDLANALKSLHANGIQAIADWVPDQVYQLPGEEVVTAKRTDNYGKPTFDAFVNNTLYAANTKSSGKDYQAQYGGAFLDELKAKYPHMFEVNMISTGKPIDPSTKIKQWEAKYFNGTNVLGKGAGYVLSDDATGTYFKVDAAGNFLPAGLTGDQNAKTGFYYDGTGMTYYSTAGNKAVNSFVYEGGHYYYFDKDGHMVTGTYKTADGNEYYFLPNGIQLRDAIHQDEKGNRYYYGRTGILYKGDNWYPFVSATNPNKTVFRYFDSNNVMATGYRDMYGQTYYFDENGFQAKGQFVTDDKGTHYFDEDNGAMAKNKFVNDGDNWYYMDGNGNAVKGQYPVDNQILYFNPETGVQVKGQFITDAQGRISYYDANSGALKSSGFFTTNGNDWYYAENGYVYKGFKQVAENQDQWYYFDQTTGKQAKGAVAVNGQQLYFDKDSGIQVKGGFADDGAGHTSYYRGDSGDKVVGGYFTTGNNAWFYADENGYVAKGFKEMDGHWYYFDDVTGQQAKGAVTVNGQQLYFDVNSGIQVKGDFVTDGQGNTSYYDLNSGDKKVGGFFTTGNNAWYYADAQGNLAKGRRFIDNQDLYFDPTTGKQVKGALVAIDGRSYYFDVDSGNMAKNRFVRINDQWIYFGNDGAATNL